VKLQNASTTAADLTTFFTNYLFLNIVPSNLHLLQHVTDEAIHFFFALFMSVCTHIFVKLVSKGKTVLVVDKKETEKLSDDNKKEK